MTGRPLELRPFRGLRFDPDVVGDLGSVVSPPYDMLDAAIVQELERANRHNVVRLILSRYFEPPYRAVRRRLETWRTHGYLRADESPALYLYEYRAAGCTVRGLIGLVGLRADDEGVILPHEDVMPAPVADRTLLMRTTETNLEPILLVHPGSPELRAVYDETIAENALAAFTALDGSQHRVWAVTDQGRLSRIAEQLAGQRALIADGHHRYAAYQALEAELAEGPNSPWRHGLAMLVPHDGEGLHIGPVHRVVAGLTLRDVEEAAVERADRLSDLREPPYGAPERGASTCVYVLTDGSRWTSLATPRSSPVDATVLHEVLLPAWQVDEEQVSYHHSLDQALQQATREPSVVVMVAPPSLADVVEAAADRVRLPRKSTSFAPKPSMGVVMRDLRDR